MTAVPNGIPSPALAATKLPLYDQSDASIYLRTFLLNCELAVKANDVLRHRMLRDAIHAYVARACYGTLEGIVDEATDALYSKLMANGCAVPDDELEADTPLPGEFPFPDPDE